MQHEDNFIKCIFYSSAIFSCVTCISYHMYLYIFSPNTALSCLASSYRVLIIYYLTKINDEDVKSTIYSIYNTLPCIYKIF